mmetsp:Transcript_33496/g.99698  ORF Transcript_33496/g.99698 Transcript_33496/m.99698 type:complete len:227 (-) Transcript_33496:116-796(-)
MRRAILLLCAAAIARGDGFESGDPPTVDDPDYVAVTDPDDVPARSPAMAYWFPEGTPTAKYLGGLYHPLSHANATCVLMPNATNGSLWGNGTYDANSALVNGTFCEVCKFLPVESPLMTRGLPCRTIYLLSGVLFVSLLLLILGLSRGSGGSGAASRSVAISSGPHKPKSKHPSRSYVKQIKNELKSKAGEKPAPVAPAPATQKFKHEVKLSPGVKTTGRPSGTLL